MLPVPLPVITYPTLHMESRPQEGRACSPTTLEPPSRESAPGQAWPASQQTHLLGTGRRRLPPSLPCAWHPDNGVREQRWGLVATPRPCPQASQVTLHHFSTISQVDSHAQGHLGSHVLKTQRRDQLESQQNKLLLSWGLSVTAADISSTNRVLFTDPSQWPWLFLLQVGKWKHADRGSWSHSQRCSRGLNQHWLHTVLGLLGVL